MKVSKKEIKMRFELKKDEYMLAEDAAKLLKKIPEMGKTLGKLHDIDGQKTYLKGTLEECLQFDIIIEIYKNYDNCLPDIIEEIDIAYEITNEITDLFNLKKDIFLGFKPTRRNKENGNIVLTNKIGELKEISYSLFELSLNPNLDNAINKLLSTTKKIDSITHFQILDSMNEVKSNLDKTIIPENVEELSNKEEPLTYVSYNTLVDLLNVWLKGDTRNCWVVKFTPKPPDHKGFIEIPESTINVKIKDNEYLEKMKKDKEPFVSGDYLICDIEIELEIKKGSLHGDIKKATIIKVHEHKNRK